jgi:hypothetical protein
MKMSPEMRHVVENEHQKVQAELRKTNGANGRADEPPPSSSNGEGEGLHLTPWWRAPADIPPRRFLFGRHYVRRTIGATIGAGGRGKTSLGTVEAVSMAIGRNLLTGDPLSDGPLRVWCLNGEEDQDELDRRFAAACKFYNVTEADLGGRLFAVSFRDTPLRIAGLVHGQPTINRQVVDQMIGFIAENHIDVFMVDPLVSFHAVAENDNMHMDVLIKQGFGTVANATNSAGEVFHHPGKPKPGQETTVEDGRGASAILWAVRSARVTNFMTPDEAAKLGIAEDDRRRHIRIANGKANMGPIGKANWMRLEVENLPSGDEIAVASHWTPPDPFRDVTAAHMQLARRLAETGEYRADSRSPRWFGYAIAPVLNIPVSAGVKGDPRDIARLHTIINKWVQNHVLELETRKVDGKDKTFITAGSFRPEPQPHSTAFPDDEYTIQ